MLNIVNFLESLCKEMLAFSFLCDVCIPASEMLEASSKK